LLGRGATSPTEISSGAKSRREVSTPQSHFENCNLVETNVKKPLSNSDVATDEATQMNASRWTGWILTIPFYKAASRALARIWL
jgi:hypothetical protein